MTSTAGARSMDAAMAASHGYNATRRTCKPVDEQEEETGELRSSAIVSRGKDQKTWARKCRRLLFQ